MLHMFASFARRSLACAAASDPLYSDNPVIEGVGPTETRPARIKCGERLARSGPGGGFQRLLQKHLRVNLREIKS